MQIIPISPTQLCVIILSVRARNYVMLLRRTCDVTANRKRISVSCQAESIETFILTRVTIYNSFMYYNKCLNNMFMFPDNLQLLQWGKCNQMKYDACYSFRFDYLSWKLTVFQKEILASGNNHIPFRWPETEIQFSANKHTHKWSSD